MKRLILIMGCVLLLVGCSGTKTSYNDAIKEMETGNYEQAISMFEELGDYEDSAEKVLEGRYQLALGLMEEEQYNDAITIFENLGDYRDSKELELECLYQTALVNLNEGNINAAMDIFANLEDYNDSKNMFKETKYLLLVSHYKIGDFDTVFNIYNDIKTYKDVGEYYMSSRVLMKCQEYYLIRYKDSQAAYEERQNNYFTIKGLNVYGKINGEEFSCEIDNIDTKKGQEKLITSMGDILLKDDKGSSTTFYWVEFCGIDFHVGVSPEQMEEIQNSQIKIEPYVGMSEEELLNKSWGKPEDKNITESIYGNSEQWVYSGYRYVYLEDGIVTTIQR